MHFFFSLSPPWFPTPLRVAFAGGERRWLQRPCTCAPLYCLHQAGSIRRCAQERACVARALARAPASAVVCGTGTLVAQRPSRTPTRRCSSMGAAPRLTTDKGASHAHRYAVHLVCGGCRCHACAVACAHRWEFIGPCAGSRTSSLANLAQLADPSGQPPSWSPVGQLTCGYGRRAPSWKVRRSGEPRAVLFPASCTLLCAHPA